MLTCWGRFERRDIGVPGSGRRLIDVHCLYYLIPGNIIASRHIVPGIYFMYRLLGCCSTGIHSYAVFDAHFHRQCNIAPGFGEARPRGMNESSTVN